MLMRQSFLQAKLQQVGIDVSQEKFDACIRQSDKFKCATFQMSKKGFDQFRQWLKSNSLTDPHLWMEATGRYFENLAEWAVERGWNVSVANPAAVRHFANSKLKIAKTDKLDSKIILRFAESASPEEIRLWAPKSHAAKELRDLQLEVAGLKKMIGQERNRLKCGLTSNTVKSAIRTTIKLLQEQANRLQLQSMRIIKSDPTLARMAVALKTIKGFDQ